MSPGRLKLSIISVTILVLAGGFFVFPEKTLATAGINKQINFQGKVVNTDGTNVIGGAHTFVFKIYNDTTLVWTDTESLTVTDGIFQYNLGSDVANAPLPGSVDFNTDNVYLGVEFDSNGEMSPRIRFTAAPYAFNADNLDGKDWTAPGTIGSGTPNTAAFTTLTTTLAATIGSTATLDPIQISPAAKGAGAFTGTISSLDLTGNHAWNFPNADGTVALTANKLSDFAVTSSLELLGNISDETGTGKLTFATSPTFLTGITLGDSSGATFVLTSALSGATDPTLTFGNDLVTVSSDLKITGDDLYMNTNTSGYILVADGTNFNPVAMSGDVSIGTGGVTAIATDAVHGTMMSLASEATGDTMYYNGTDWVRLGEGTNDGYALKINTVTHAPYWSADLQGGGGGTLQNAYDYASGNTILTTDTRNIAFTLVNVVTPTSFTIENQDTAGVSAQRIYNSIASGTLTNGLLIEQTGAGALTNGIQILGTAGAISNGLLITDGAGTLDKGIVMTGTITTAILDTPSLDISGTGAITGATGVSSTTGTFSSAIAANGGITFDHTTDTIGAFTLNGTMATGTQNITGTNFGITGSTGAFNTQGTIEAGSGNEVITLASGKIDAGAIGLMAATDALTGSSSASGMAVYSDTLSLLQGCLDGQVLAWVETTDTWNCTTPVAGGGGDAGYGVEAVTAVAANGTWTRPGAYVTNVFVEVWGAGAGGLAANSNNSMGGGGGGEYRAGIVAVSGNVNVVVGAGGSNNNSGTNSTFPGTTTIDAKGGTKPITIAGGAGGTGGSGGTVALNGQAGGNGQALDGAKSGGGGAAARGGAGGKEAGGANAGNSAKAGGSGQVPGGGGAGGAENTGAAGIGAAGYVVVWSLSGTNGSDLAEVYETKPDVEVGDVVSMSQDSFKYDSEWGLQNISILEKARPESRVVGVVSTQAAVTMGRKISETAKNPLPIALAGRTPVKVSLENGPIKSGDLLAPSSIPGVATKSVKSGMIIGAALEDYVPPPDGDIGKVMIFVSTEYSSGARNNVLLEKAGLDPDNIPANIDVGRIMLTQSLLEKKNIIKATPLSEIFTDRVVAGLEIVSPRVLADTLVVNSIEPAEKDVKMKLLENGNFVIERIGQETLSTTFGENSAGLGTTVVSIDAQGNADFAGTITADSIAANKIVGLEIYTDKLSVIDESVADLSAKLDTLQTTGENIDLSALGILEKKGGLTIAKETTFKETTIFEKLVTLVGNVLFRGEVSFEKIPIFNQDMGGYAVIQEGADIVSVKFKNEYSIQPIVNASLLLQQIKDEELRKTTEELLLLSDVKFIITNVTTEGFEIRISQKALSEIPFSWQALAVKDAKTFESESVAIQTPADDLNAENGAAETVPSGVTPPGDNPIAPASNPISEQPAVPPGATATETTVSAATNIPSESATN